MNALMAVKDIANQAVARFVLEEMRKGVIYRMVGTNPNLKQRDDPEAFRGMQPTIVVLWGLSIILVPCGMRLRSRSGTL